MGETVGETGITRVGFVKGKIECIEQKAKNSGNEISLYLNSYTLLSRRGEYTQLVHSPSLSAHGNSQSEASYLRYITTFGHMTLCQQEREGKPNPLWSLVLE